MPYSIDRYSVPTTYVVEDGTIDSSLDIKLIGKNYAGYGEVQNENFVHLLENFAGIAAPPRPISGQIWYDSSVKKLKFYDSTSSRWKTTGGAEVATSAPAGLTQGDFWYDSVNKQIYVYDGNQYVLVGPQGVAGLGTTQLKSIVVTDNDTGASHAIIEALVDGEVIFVISADAFELSTTSLAELPGFRYIKSGVTLANTDNTDGITDPGTGMFNPNIQMPDKILWGTVSNALQLNGFTDEDFVKVGDYGNFGDPGFAVGDSGDLEIYIDNDGETPVFKSTTNNTIKFLTYNSGTPGSPYQPLVLEGQNVRPGVNNVTSLGSSSFKFTTVYATTFDGTASQADELKVGSVYASADVSATADTVVVRNGAGAINATAFLGNATTATTAATATNSDNLKVGASYRQASVDTAANGSPNTVACRDVDGNLNAVLFQGTATSALFADLAEKYLADQDYEVGTVVVVGGDAEVTACSMGERAFGAVSANPAFKMNEGLEGGTYIALKGRVPIKVVGAVRKGDRLIASNDGCAGVSHVILRNLPVRAGNFPDTFAIALESSDDEGCKLIEAIIL